MKPIQNKKELFIMMNLIILTICITVAILMASALACVIMLQPKVIKWYLKHVMKVTNEIVEMDDLLKG